MMASQTAPASPDTGDDDIATFGQRFLGLLADWVLCLLIANGALRLGLLPYHDYLWPPVLLVVECTFFLGLFGQTPGMRLARTRCVRLADGRPPGVPRAFVRSVLLAVVLPIVTAIYDPRRRGLHDVASGTIMVRDPAR